MAAKEEYVVLVESLQIGWSRQGEYEYEAESEDDEGTTGLGNAVSSMAHDDDEEEEDDDDDLFGAARQNLLEQVREHIARGEDVNSQDQDASHGLTALHYACDRGHMDLAKLLKEFGADINAKFEVAEWLVRNNCELSTRDAEGLTAFEQADDAFVAKLKETCGI
ncbi:hypothetical protein DFQ29_005721 [Apophysomyces sp. BC1021]|nr:hypothetical protein DFQ29_005721 [Apophysomyces sp. BC1021]